MRWKSFLSGILVGLILTTIGTVFIVRNIEGDLQQARRDLREVRSEQQAALDSLGRIAAERNAARAALRRAESRVSALEERLGKSEAELEKLGESLAGVADALGEYRSISEEFGTLLGEIGDESQDTQGK